MLEKLPDSLGHALRHQRAGLEKTVFQRMPLRNGQGAIEVRSLAFVDHAPIPTRYTADGAGCSPPLQWSGVPPAARAMVLIVEDADAPVPSPLVHAIAVNLPGGDGAVAEGALDRKDDSGAALELGRSRSSAPAGAARSAAGARPHRYINCSRWPTAGLQGHPGRDVTMRSPHAPSPAAAWSAPTSGTTRRSGPQGGSRRAEPTPRPDGAPIGGLAGRALPGAQQ
jgi:phosphatidylethanolamine-binding protein (PEBP) family uncharacterized protein